MLHVPALAHEAGIRLDLKIFNEVSARTPHLVSLSPAGPHHLEDLDQAGGVMAVMAELAGAGLIDQEVTVPARRPARKVNPGNEVPDWFLHHYVQSHQEGGDKPTEPLHPAPLGQQENCQKAE